MTNRIIIILPYFIKVLQKLFGISVALKFLNYITGGEKFFYLKKQYDNILNKTVIELILLLPGKGCSWAKKTGGCTMCALYQKAYNYSKKISNKDLVLLYKIANYLTKKDKPEVIKIFNGGSFLNDEEINKKIQFKIIKLISKHKTIKKIFIESRPEYIEKNTIKNLVKILNNKIFEIGIGLECVNDYIRNKIINKGINIDIYKKVINILKNNNVKSLTYILIKPINISEKRAISEAIDTARFIFENGGDEISFEASFIQPSTTMENLYNKGLYKPPWLWSVIKILLNTYKLGKINLGNFEDEPPPIAIPLNCNKCTKNILKTLKSFRETNNISLLKLLPNCKCKNQWIKEIRE